MSDREKRLLPPQLNRVPPEDLERMEREGLGTLYTPTPEDAERLTTAFNRVWNLFYADFVEDGKPSLTALFTWDADTSEGDFAPPNDAICCGWGDHAGIGVARAAFSHDDNYLALLILHELTHLREPESSGGKGEDHDADFENHLQYLLNVYNDAYGASLENDFAGFKEECKLKQNQQRADSMAVPSSWAQMFAKGHTVQKKGKAPANDSAERYRKTMIRRMQKKAEVERNRGTQVEKSYNGSRLK